MAPGVFTRDEIEIKEFKNGRCVLEASGNSSSSSTRCVLRRIPVADLLYLTYMVENGPFEKLPISYKPVQRSGHYPPTLNFGFAIPDELTQFLPVAVENKPRNLALGSVFTRSRLE